MNVFKEKEFPQYFATGIVTLAMMTNLYILLSLVEYLMLPVRFNLYGEYYKYFTLIVLVIALFYVNYKKRYLRILEYSSNISERKKRKLRIVSVVYLLFLFIVFFLLGALIREYNINHPK
jgi:hypothetical protein